MTNRTAPRLVAFVVLALMAGQASSAKAALLLGSSVSGSLQFPSFSTTTNFFDSSNGYVPPGFLNSNGSTIVTIGEPAVEFGFDDTENQDSANFTDTTLTITNISIVGSGGSSIYSFNSSAFAGLTVTKTADTYVNGGVTFTFSDNTLTVTAPAFRGLATTNVLSATFTFARPVTANGVPEPSTVASLGLAGVIGLAARLRRKARISA